MGSSKSKPDVSAIPDIPVPVAPTFTSIDNSSIDPALAQVIPEIETRVSGLETQATALQSQLSDLTGRVDVVAPIPVPEVVPTPGFFTRLFEGFMRHYHIWLFFLVLGFFIYGAYNTYTASAAQVLQIQKLNVRGKYIDASIHQLNILEWNDSSSVKRTVQGTTTTEIWTLDQTNNRYIIKSYTPYHYAYYDPVTFIVQIKDNSGTLLTTLTRESNTPQDPDTSNTLVCQACATSSINYPTYANFATLYRLVHLNVFDQPTFVSSLDTLRECAMFHIDLIPVGVNSNNVLGASAFAVPLDNSCFFYVPPVNYNFLKSNGIIDTEIALGNLPTSFCGSM